LDPDLFFVIGIVLIAFAIPAIISAFSESRAPRAARSADCRADRCRARSSSSSSSSSTLLAKRRRGSGTRGRASRARVSARPAHVRQSAVGAADVAEPLGHRPPMRLARDARHHRLPRRTHAEPLSVVVRVPNDLLEHIQIERFGAEPSLLGLLARLKRPHRLRLLFHLLAPVGSCR